MFLHFKNQAAALLVDKHFRAKLVDDKLFQAVRLQVRPANERTREHTDGQLMLRGRVCVCVRESRRHARAMKWSAVCGTCSCLAAPSTLTTSSLRSLLSCVPLLLSTHFPPCSDWIRICVRMSSMPLLDSKRKISLPYDFCFVVLCRNTKRCRWSSWRIRCDVHDLLIDWWANSSRSTTLTTSLPKY